MSWAAAGILAGPLCVAGALRLVTGDTRPEGVAATVSEGTGSPLASPTAPPASDVGSAPQAAPTAAVPRADEPCPDCEPAFAEPSGDELAEPHFASFPRLADVAFPAGAEPGGLGPVTSAGGSMPVVAATGLTFPVYATSMPGDPRLFVVEKAGRIRIVENGVIRPEPFLDIPGRVGSGGNEQGLLGLAFDPAHALNGLFYIYYTDNRGDSVLARYEVGSDPNVAIPSRQEILLTVDQPQSNHNGGTIAFSPVDGYLYWGLGDGGGANDPGDNAQDGRSLLGKMLRLDVSGGFGSGYSVPNSNPFFGDPRAEDEIWGLGLRNPYRFAFDSMTGDLWIGDVGQNAREEVDYEPAASSGGLNWGWPVREGTIAGPKPSMIALGTLTDPEQDYAHVSGGCGGSVTGGTVYRGGEAMYFGEYFYADYCTGELWTVVPGEDPTDRTVELAPASGTPFQITAITEGGFEDLYVVHANGTIYRVGPTGDECNDGIDNDGDGEIDVAGDTGCLSDTDPSELEVDTPCDDGYDNDGDGLIDIADDDCPVSASAGELPPTNGGGDDDDGGGGGGGCGIGVELVVVLPLLGWLRGRRRRPRA
ncbi:MAG: PQQ-dependent sugar dehydrogenase [Myxococcota bacterium]|nr:PQQ-dependent sugar dehydrogenase [Myxococcota bacterium]